MKKILYIISDFSYRGSAKQVSLITSGLPRDQFEPHLAILGTPTSWSASLAGSGIHVQTLGWHRSWDLAPFIRLRKLIQDFKPDLVHCWHLPALRAIAPWGSLSRVLVTDPMSGFSKKASLNIWDRLLLRHARKVIVNRQCDLQRARQLGIPEENLIVVPLGVLDVTDGMAPPFFREESLDLNRETVLRSVRLPANARYILGIGPLEPNKGFRNALWAFDILKYLYDDLHLVLVGQGSALTSLIDFARAIHLLDRVHFVGCLPRIDDLRAAAEVVWVPGQTNGGGNVALEAMAGGRPVVATDVPEFQELIENGKSGCLVPLGDKVALARETRLLLEQPERRRLLGEGGRDRALKHFSLNEMTRRYGELYETILTQDNSIERPFHAV